MTSSVVSVLVATVDDNVLCSAIVDLTEAP